MKTFFERVEGINFKKLFIAFFAVFFLFNVVSLIYALSSSQWTSAVNAERNRIEARMGSEHSHGMAGRRSGRFGSSTQSNRSGRSERSGRSSQRRFAVTNEAYPTQAEATNNSDQFILSSRDHGNRLLNSLARTYVRMTETEFNILNVFGLLLRVAFTALLSLWVYVDSKKHERNTFLWTAFTIFTSIFGWAIYMIVRNIRKNKKDTTMLNSN